MDRWATFDCYGTLIDWNGGIGRELERLFGAANAPRLLHRYHEIEPEVQREEPVRAYRDVLNVTLARLAASEGLALPDAEGDALSRSLPTWEPFPEVRESLEDARARGWKLAILSNTDRDYIEASMEKIGVPVRAGDRRVRDRLVQAGAAPLGGLLRACRCRSGGPCPRRREPLPRRRPGGGARAADDLDQPAR